MKALDVLLTHLPALLAFIISIVTFKYIFIKKTDAITEAFDETTPTSKKTDDVVLDTIKSIRSEIMNKETEMESLLRSIGDKDVEITNKILSKLAELENQMGGKSRKNTVQRQEKNSNTRPSEKITKSSKEITATEKKETQLVDDGSDYDSSSEIMEIMEEDDVVETFVEGIPSASSVKFHKIR